MKNNKDLNEILDIVDLIETDPAHNQEILDVVYSKLADANKQTEQERHATYELVKSILSDFFDN